ncbi:MAG: hypothetical protein AAFX92_14830 [Pseudomonadota bacterium]
MTPSPTATTLRRSLGLPAVILFGLAQNGADHRLRYLRHLGRKEPRHWGPVWLLCIGIAYLVTLTRQLTRQPPELHMAGPGEVASPLLGPADCIDHLSTTAILDPSIPSPEISLL